MTSQTKANATEFNLSEKIREKERTISINDAKEFIKIVKEEINEGLQQLEEINVVKRIDTNIVKRIFMNVIKGIDKLAGDKLK